MRESLKQRIFIFQCEQRTDSTYITICFDISYAINKQNHHPRACPYEMKAKRMHVKPWMEANEWMDKCKQKWRSISQEVIYGGVVEAEIFTWIRLWVVASQCWKWCIRFGIAMCRLWRMSPSLSPIVDAYEGGKSFCEGGN